MNSFVRRGNDLVAGAVAIYSWDWSDLMTDLEDSLSGSSWAVEGGITQASHDRDGDETAIKIEADTAGEARAINTVTTTGGLTFLGTLCITVRPV